MRAQGTIKFCFCRKNSIDRIVGYLYEQEFTFYSDDLNIENKSTNNDKSVEEKYEEFLQKLKKYMDEEYGKSYLDEKTVLWDICFSGKIVNEMGDRQKDMPCFIYHFPMNVRWEQLFGNITTPIAMIKTFSEQGYRNYEI